MSASPVGQNRWLSFLNSSGETIPPFAVMQIDGTDDTDPARPVIKVKQPEGNWGEHLFLINGLTEVADGDYSLATRDLPTYALFEMGSNDPALGEVWGPQAESWKLHRNGAGFRVLGGIKDDKVVVVPHAVSIVEGFLDDELSPRHDATLAVHINDEGELIATDVTVTVVDRAGLTAEAGDYLMAVYINGEWRPISLASSDGSTSAGSSNDDDSGTSDGSTSASNSTSGSGSDDGGGDESGHDGSGSDGGSDGSDPSGSGSSSDNDSDSGTSSSSFDCDSGQRPLDVVTDVRCEDGDIVVCTRRLCLPAGTRIGPEECGPGSSNP